MTATDPRSHATKPRREPRRATVGDADRDSANQQPTKRRAADDARHAVAYMLNHLLQRDDGWLRMVPHPLDDVLYIKWKFNKGVHSGCYVMSRVASFQLDYGLDLLLDKLAAVDEGSRRPTRDTAYDA